MPLLLSSIHLALPWILTAALAFSLSRYRLRFGFGDSLVVSAAYGTLGYLLISGLIAHGAFPLLGAINPVVLTAVCVFSAYLLVIGVPVRVRAKLDLATLSMALSLTSVLGVFAIFHFYLPLHSWDTLTHWAPEAANLIDQIRRGEPTPLEVGFKKHPIYHYCVLLWSGMTSTKYLSAPVGLAWLLCGVCLAALVAGYTYATTNSRAFAFMFATIAVSLPLVENHIILSGYAEIFMVVLLCGGAALLARGLKLHSPAHIGIGLIPIAAVTFIKNIGFIYSFLCLLSFVIAITCNSPTRLSCVIVATLAGCIGFWLAWELGVSFEINWFFIHFGFNIDSPLIAGKGIQPSIAVGNRYLLFSDFSIYKLFQVEAHSRFLLASFTTTFLIILASLYLVTQNLYKSLPNDSSFFFLVIFATLLFCLFNFSLQFDDGIRYALPGQDTGFSRMSLLMMAVSPLLLGHLVAHCNDFDHSKSQSTHI